jgi:hypothetical protein
MSKRNIPADRGPRNDWHAMMKSVGRQPALFDSHVAVGVKKDITTITGAPTQGTMILAGALGLGGALILAGGLASLMGLFAAMAASVAMLAVGAVLIGGGLLVFLIRPGICVSSDGAELIVVCGPGKRFHLSANELIPRLSSDADSDICLKLYNIKLRQGLVLVKGDRDYAAGVLVALDEMLGTDKLDSTFVEVKLAGLAEEWVDVEPTQPTVEPQGDDAPAAPSRSGSPMRAGGFIFFGARLQFPEKGQASIQLPVLRRIGPPLGICVALWFLVTLLLLVVGGMLGVSEVAAVIVGELGFAALVLGVGAFFWRHGAPITIDRIKRTISGPHRPRCGFTGRDISTHEVEMVQSCWDAPPGSDPKTDTVRYELNLVMKDASRRVHLLTDSDAQRVRQSADELAEFLNVSHWDCSTQDG